MNNSKGNFNLPNILTMARIAIVPVVVACFFVKGSMGAWAAGILFVIAAITDYFDGYLARRYKSTSKLGMFLDPIADKVLVSSVLLMLAYTHKLGEYGLIPALIILCREILVSGLREFLAELNVGMPVSRLAKWKTAFQLIALPLLIVGDYGYYFTEAGEITLWLAAILTIITGYDYLKSGLQHFD